MIFDCILKIIGKKHLMVEWLLWLPYKSGYINSNILETSKDRPNIPPSLNLSEQRVHELVGGRGSLNNVVVSKRLRSGRADQNSSFFCPFYHFLARYKPRLKGIRPFFSSVTATVIGSISSMEFSDIIFSV